ncbi:hypothetical protein ACFLVW_07195 [Chloroflexota bacterium]
MINLFVMAAAKSNAVYSHIPTILYPFQLAMYTVLREPTKLKLTI